ncbi:unnamed protein product [Linum trigynum]|uniref:Uncharacterized protein n=1 Tax=Linum trigynum TaxID=586398 RepID=A0AAV2EB08_9ROSI
MEAALQNFGEFCRQLTHDMAAANAARAMAKATARAAAVEAVTKQTTVEVAVAEAISCHALNGYPAPETM